jgi:hypothetical protein
MSEHTKTQKDGIQKYEWLNMLMKKVIYWNGTRIRQTVT